VEDAGEPVYLRSGHLLFRRRGSLLVAPFDPVELELTGQAVPIDVPAAMVWPPYPVGTTQLKASNGGTLFYLPMQDEATLQRKLTWVQADGQSQQIWASSENYFPRLSPDGKQVSVTFWQAGQVRVDLVELERGVSRLVAQAPSIMWTNAVWSKQGTELFFGSGSGGEGTLYRKRLDTSEPPEALQTWPSEWGAIPWSVGPRGEVAVTTWGTETQTDIRFYSPEDAEELPTNFTTAATEQQPMFSPDGRFLAYLSDKSGIHEIYIAEYPSGGQERQVTNGGGTGPIWSPDGRRLYFQSLDGASLFGLDVELASELRLGDVETVLRGAFDKAWDMGHRFDIAADGEQFLMVAITENLYTGFRPVVIQDWFAELERLVPTK